MEPDKQAPVPPPQEAVPPLNSSAPPQQGVPPKERAPAHLHPWVLVLLLALVAAADAWLDRFHPDLSGVAIAIGGTGLLALLIVVIFGASWTRLSSRRFQFSLFELLFLLALVGATLCAIGPFGLRDLTPVLVIVAVVCGCWAVGLVWAWQRQASLAGRIFGETLVPLLILFLLLIAYPSHYHGPMPRNESSAIACCKTYAEAQDIYRRTDWDGDGQLEYARSFTGDFSLFERYAGSGDVQLVDQSLANAEFPKGTAPKSGYWFRILRGQGPSAPGGAMSYLSKGTDGKVRLTAGYALVAWPAEWDKTGRNTFVINNRGTVYQSDLGEDTAKLVGRMALFDPDPKQGWTPAEYGRVPGPPAFPRRGSPTRPYRGGMGACNISRHRAMAASRWTGGA